MLKKMLSKLADGKKLYFIHRYGNYRSVMALDYNRDFIVSRENQYIKFQVCVAQNEYDTCKIYAETENVDWSFNEKVALKLKDNPNTIAANDYH